MRCSAKTKDIECKQHAGGTFLALRGGARARAREARSGANDRHGKPTPVNLSGNDYFVDFAGNSGAVVIPLKANTAK
jgi:hypothetical protein